MRTRLRERRNERWEDKVISTDSCWQGSFGMQRLGTCIPSDMGSGDTTDLLEQSQGWVPYGPLRKQGMLRCRSCDTEGWSNLCWLSRDGFTLVRPDFCFNRVGIPDASSPLEHCWVERDDLRWGWTSSQCQGESCIESRCGVAITLNLGQVEPEGGHQVLISRAWQLHRKLEVERQCHSRIKKTKVRSFVSQLVSTRSRVLSGSPISVKDRCVLLGRPCLWYFTQLQSSLSTCTLQLCGAQGVGLLTKSMS